MMYEFVNSPHNKYLCEQTALDCNMFEESEERYHNRPKHDKFVVCEECINFSPSNQGLEQALVNDIVNAPVGSMCIICGESNA